MPASLDTIRVQLNFPLERVSEPVLYRLVKDFGLVPNIRRANIDLRTGGYVFLELSGDRDALQRGLAFLQSIGVGVNAIGLDGVEEWVI